MLWNYKFIPYDTTWYKHVKFSQFKPRNRLNAIIIISQQKETDLAKQVMCELEA